VAAGILREWLRGTLVRHRRGENYALAFFRLVVSNRPRYGGYIVHLAVVLLACSVTGSSFYTVTRDVSLPPGGRVEVGGYTIEYVSATAESLADRIERRATVRVYRGDRLVETLTPGYAFYPDFSMAATRAGIRSTAAEDLYIVANEFGDDGSAIFRISINPLMIWMWIAGPVLVLGTLVALWPERRLAVSSASQLMRSLEPVSAGR
jgi:cytochrome c-type biogenesis protein CcmF